jgi:hypothetical protein
MGFLNWLWRRDVEIFLAAAAVVLLLTCGGC